MSCCVVYVVLYLYCVCCVVFILCMLCCIYNVYVVLYLYCVCCVVLIYSYTCMLCCISHSGKEERLQPIARNLNYKSNQIKSAVA